MATVSVPAARVATVRSWVSSLNFLACKELALPASSAAEVVGAGADAIRVSAQRRKHRSASAGTRSREMKLGASSGKQVTVRAVGPDARDAVETLMGILSTVTKIGD